MTRSWFDPETRLLRLDEYVADMPSFRKIIADDVVSDQELLEHGRRVVALLEELEARLPDDLRELMTETLCELAVLYAVQRAGEAPGRR